MISRFNACAGALAFLMAMAPRINSVWKEARFELTTYRLANGDVYSCSPSNVLPNVAVYEAKGSPNRFIIVDTGKAMTQIGRLKKPNGEKASSLAIVSYRETDFDLAGEIRDLDGNNILPLPRKIEDVVLASMAQRLSICERLNYASEKSPDNDLLHGDAVIDDALRLGTKPVPVQIFRAAY